MLCFPPHISSASALPCKIENPEDSPLVHCACNKVQLLQRYRLPFSWTMPPTVPSWTHWLQDLRSHTATWVWGRESKRLKKSSSWLNSGNAVIQHLRKMQFSRFSIYFCQKYQNSLTYVKVIASQRWDVFWDTVYMSQGSVATRLRHGGMFNDDFIHWHSQNFLLGSPNVLCRLSIRDVLEWNICVIASTIQWTPIPCLRLVGNRSKEPRLDTPMTLLQICYWVCGWKKIKIGQHLAK